MSSQERFGYEWNKFKKITPEYETQFLKWIYPLTKEDFKDKIILDAGCGMGRNSYWPLMYGVKKAVAFDFDKRTVNAAKMNLSVFDNAEIVYGSIYEIDFPYSFDVVFSIGVVHHLEKPKKAVKNLTRLVKPGGKFLIWVYGKEGNEWIVRYINPIRKMIFSRLPVWLTNVIAYLFSVPLFFFLRMFPQKHPYLKQLKDFRFWHIHSIVFDQLLPKVANYWSKDEALGLLRVGGLKDVKAYRVNNNSWTVLGTKI